MREWSVRASGSHIDPQLASARVGSLQLTRVFLASFLLLSGGPCRPIANTQHSRPAEESAARQRAPEKADRPAKLSKSREEARGPQSQSKAAVKRNGDDLRMPECIVS